MTEQLQTTKPPGLPRLLYQSVKAAFYIRFGKPAVQTSGFWNRGRDWINGIFSNSSVNWIAEAGSLVQSSLVMSAVNWLGRVLPQAPIQVMKADAKGKEKPVIGHPAVALLKRPNPYYSFATLMKAFALSWIISGNGYLLKVRNQSGQVIQLWYAPPDCIHPVWPSDESEFISYYEYNHQGIIFNVQVDDVIHFRDGLDPANNGRTGFNSLSCLLREICADNEVPVFHYLLLKGGGIPPVVLALKDGQSSTEFDAATIKAKYLSATGGDQRGKVFVSGNAMEITKMSFSPAEMDLKVLRHLPESRFASVIGIAKETLGFGAADESSTYANVQQADERSIQTYVLPLWSYVEDELTHQLGPDFGLDANERFDFDLSEIAALQEDADSLHKRATGDLASGGILIDEFREAIGLEPLPDGAGQVLLIPSSVQPMTPEAINHTVEMALNPPEPILQIGAGNAPKQLVNGRAKDEVMN